MTNIQKDSMDFEDFQKLDIRMAKITKVEEIEDADKLYKITLDVGELGKRTVAAGIKQWYSPEDLVGKLVPYLSNLEPKTLRGIESQGMILAADDNGAVLLHPTKDVKPGAVVR
ncbi:methionine--tRNA ligase subunit beta [Patescibacteria group bacterium]